MLKRKLILWAVVFLILPSYFVLYPHYNDQERRPWGPSCSLAVRQVLNKNFSEIHREWENDIRQCENEILDEQKNYSVRPFVFGDTREKRELIKEYAAAAQLYSEKIKEGDLKTLILLDWAKPNTNREEYMKAYLNHYGVIDLSDGQFPVKLFENSEVPLPARQHHIPAIYWLDEDRIIYRIDADDSRSENVHQEQIISVNLKTLEIKRNYTENDLENTSHYRYQLTYDWQAEGPLHGCVKLLDEDGHVCWPNFSSKNRVTNKGEIQLVRGDGTKKALSFPVPIDIEAVYFDPFSKTYWFERDEKVWRFDRSFEKTSEEHYSTDLWTHNLSCGYGCSLLKFSTKYGFLISRPRPINDPDSRHKVFDISGLFLLAKDGKVMRIYTPPYLEPLAVSPSGCKVAFVQRGSQDERAHDQVGLIDVCSYFSQEAPH